MSSRKEYKMTFGKHKGTSISLVPAHYLDWLAGQDWVREKFPQIMEYVRENREHLDREMEELEGMSGCSEADIY